MRLLLAKKGSGKWTQPKVDSERIKALLNRELKKQLTTSDLKYAASFLYELAEATAGRTLMATRLQAAEAKAQGIGSEPDAALYAISVGRDSRIVDALLRSSIVPDDLSNLEQLQVRVDEIASFIEKEYPELLEHLRVVRMDDPIAAAKKLVFVSKVGGSDCETVVDVAFLLDQRFLSLRKKLTGAKV